MTDDERTDAMYRSMTDQQLELYRRALQLDVQAGAGKPGQAARRAFAEPRIAAITAILAERQQEPPRA